MASGPHTFVTMVVFTPERFQGNPLAVVSVRGNALTQQRKALIAREFGYSETVFLHDAAGPGQPRRLEIFTETGEELSFAGHPIIGATHYIFGSLERAAAGPHSQSQTAVFFLPKNQLQVPVFYNSYRQVAACSVPHQLHVHSKRVSLDSILAVQPQTQIVPTIDKLRGRTFPVVSIVKGMAFVLVDLSDAVEVFRSLGKGNAPEVELDTGESGGWGGGFVGCLYFIRKGMAEQAGEPTILNLQCRMISHGMEDPGTGSACCALACYLALGEDQYKQVTERESGDEQGYEDDLAKKTQQASLEDAEAKGAPQTPTTSDKPEEKMERKVFGIQQGVEMGRLCTIAVEVDVKTGKDGKPVVANVILSGRANLMLKGELVGA